MDIAGKGNAADEYPTDTRPALGAARGRRRWLTPGGRRGRGSAGAKGTAVLGAAGSHARARPDETHLPPRRAAPPVHPRAILLISLTAARVL